MGSPTFQVSDDDRGTPPSVWRDWKPTLPTLETATWERVVVVSAHPDDDVLGIGGLLGRLASRGVQIVGVQATDGTAAYPDSPTVTPAELGALRVREVAEAYAVLGLGEPVRLGLPDGGLARCEDQLVDLLGEMLMPGDRWLVPWRSDRHPDHEAVARAALRLCSDQMVELWEYPIWMYHWAAPREVPKNNASLVQLTAEERHLKRQAAGCFRSQIAALSDHPADAPVVPPYALERLVTEREIVFGG